MTIVHPNTHIKALVQIVHGMAEHKDRYLSFMQYLAEAGYACIICDLRGHGASLLHPDDQGYFYQNGSKAMIRDLHQLSIWFREKHPNKKLFMLGHSMGSLAARVFAAQYGLGINGLILTGSPGFNPVAKLGILLTHVLATFHRSTRSTSRIMDKIVLSPFQKAFPNEGSSCAWLSVNKRNVAVYEADPFCGFSLTLNGYRALFELMVDAYDINVGIRRNLPVHFMSGQDDPCAPNAVGFFYAVENIRSRGCTCVSSKIYPGLRHEILNEGVIEVWEDVKNTFDSWI